MAEAETAALEVVQRMESAELLRAVAAIAEQRALNIELRRENARLKNRIAEEDARLAHA